jgi:hypothetical protein
MPFRLDEVFVLQDCASLVIFLLSLRGDPQLVGGNGGTVYQCEGREQAGIVFRALLCSLKIMRRVPRMYQIHSFAHGCGKV